MANEKNEVEQFKIDLNKMKWHKYSIVFDIQYRVLRKKSNKRKTGTTVLQTGALPKAAPIYNLDSRKVLLISLVEYTVHLNKWNKY